jgi:hypothetical protein
MPVSTLVSVFRFESDIHITPFEDEVGRAKSILINWAGQQRQRERTVFLRSKRVSMRHYTIVLDRRFRPDKKSTSIMGSDL